MLVRRESSRVPDHDGRRLRVLHVNKLYHPWIGGIERFVQDLCEALSDRFSMEVLACVPKGRGGVEHVNGVSVVKASSLGMLIGMPISPTLPFLLARMSRSQDVIHLHFPFPIGALAYLLVASRRPKLVVHYHSDLVRQRGFLTLYRWLARAVLKRADEIVVTSRGLLENSEVLAPLRERCSVIPLFVRELPSPSAEVIEEVRARANLSVDDTAVLFVGRLAYYKGVSYLIDAMEGLDGKLLVVGTGPLEAEVRDLVVSRGLRERVVFLSNVGDEELAACYTLARAFVLPSIETTEAFGLVQIEAMSHGLPVVNTALPTGVPWVSQDGLTGTTVPPRDVRALREAIAALLHDRELSTRYGRAARTRAETFSRESVVRQITALYEGGADAR